MRAFRFRSAKTVLQLKSSKYRILLKSLFYLINCICIVTTFAALSSKPEAFVARDSLGSGCRCARESEPSVRVIRPSPRSLRCRSRSIALPDSSASLYERKGKRWIQIRNSKPNANVACSKAETFSFKSQSHVIQL